MLSKPTKFALSDIVEELYTYAYFWLGKSEHIESVMMNIFRPDYHSKHMTYYEFRIKAIQCLVSISYQRQECDEKYIQETNEAKKQVGLLPLPYRIPLLLQMKGGFCCREVAEILKTTQSEVESQLVAAKLMVKNHLS